MIISEALYQEAASNMGASGRGCLKCKKLQLSYKGNPELCPFCKKPWVTMADVLEKIASGEIILMSDTGLMRAKP
jgi:hypothetical protein